VLSGLGCSDCGIHSSGFNLSLSTVPYSPFWVFQFFCCHQKKSTGIWSDDSSNFFLGPHPPYPFFFPQTGPSTRCDGVLPVGRRFGGFHLMPPVTEGPRTMQDFIYPTVGDPPPPRPFPTALHLSAFVRTVERVPFCCFFISAAQLPPFLGQAFNSAIRCPPSPLFGSWSRYQGKPFSPVFPVRAGRFPCRS